MNKHPTIANEPNPPPNGLEEENRDRRTERRVAILDFTDRPLYRLESVYVHEGLWTPLRIGLPPYPQHTHTLT